MAFFFSAYPLINQLYFEGRGAIPTFFFGLVYLDCREIISSTTLHVYKLSCFPLSLDLSEM